MTNNPEGALPASVQKVQDAARALGLQISILQMPESTRTAQEAAAACNCDAGQILKSLLFRGADTAKPYMALVSGANRLNEKGVAALLGEALVRPDAAYVREITGFAIGGVPPFGHANHADIIMDEDLLAYETVWAAAGTPRTLFSIAPGALADAVEARIMKVS